MMDHRGGAGPEGLRISGPAKRFGGVQAVQELSIDEPPGALIGFLGPGPVEGDQVKAIS